MIAALIDVVVFILATAQGAHLVQAHLLSFGVATLANYFIGVRGPAVAAGRASDWRLYGHLIVVALFALFLRGGMLGLLVNRAGVAAQLAIVPAALVALLVSLSGNSLALRNRLWRIDGPDSAGGIAVWLVLIAFGLRLVYLGQVELLPEDSYYWNYAQHPSPGYLDHPPMVAWIIWLGTHLFGDSEFGVRIGAFGCSILAAGFAYRLTKNLFGVPSAVVAVVLMQALPFFFLGGMLMTPDAPLTAAWVASLYFLERALIAGQSRAWLLAGVSLGLGMVSKYTVGMLVPAALLFVVLDPASRRWLLRWEPYAAVLIAAVLFSPVIIWNAQHEWASFAFQTSRRLAEAPRFALHKLIISMLVLLTPTGFLTLLTSRFASRGGPRPDAPDAPDAQERRRWLFIRLAVLVPVAVFAAFSLRHDVKIDWTGAPWLGAVPALAATIVDYGSRAVRGLRGWLYSAWCPTAVVMLLLYAAGLHYLALGLPGVGYSRRLELVPVGWQDLGRQINMLKDEVRGRTGLEPIVVGMDRYELASQLAFYSPDHSRSVPNTSSRNLFGQNGLMYGRWASSLQVGDRPLILVAWDPHDLSDELTASYVASLSEPRQGVVSRDGKAIREYHYRIAQGLRSPAPPAPAGQTPEPATAAAAAAGNK